MANITEYRCSFWGMGDLESHPNAPRTDLKNREMVVPNKLTFFQERTFIFSKNYINFYRKYLSIRYRASKSLRIPDSLSNGVSQPKRFSMRIFGYLLFVALSGLARADAMEIGDCINSVIEFTSAWCQTINFVNYLRDLSNTPLVLRMDKAETGR